jgi:hypothetical protein
MERLAIEPFLELPDRLPQCRLHEPRWDDSD